MKVRVWSTESAVTDAVRASRSAIDIFTSTIAKLLDANDKLASAREKDLEQIRLIQENVNRANNQENSNNETINKINAIFGEALTQDAIRNAKL